MTHSHYTPVHETQRRLFSSQILDTTSTYVIVSITIDGHVLIINRNDFSVLSDILGDEDHLGDMDFKVAGTKDGITSLQMDIKITGITFEIMEQALNQAKDGRIHILGEMNKALNKS